MKRENMLTGEALRGQLLDGFSEPEFLTVVVRQAEANGANYGTAYAAAKQLIANKLLIPAGSALDPAKKKMQTKYVNPAAQPSTAASASALSAKTVATSSRQQSKPTWAFDVQPRFRLLADAPAHPVVGAAPMRADNEPDIRQLCSILGHHVADFDLGIRDLSDSERTAMVRLSEMIRAKVEEHGADARVPARVEPNLSQEPGVAHPEKSTDAHWQQSA